MTPYKPPEDRITPELAREIRDEHAATGKSARRIAVERGLQERSVQNVVSGRTFLEAGGPIRKIEAPPRHDFTDAQLRRIRLLSVSKTSKEVAEMFGCSESLVRHIWTGRVAPHRALLTRE